MYPTSLSPQCAPVPAICEACTCNVNIMLSTVHHRGSVSVDPDLNGLVVCEISPLLSYFGEVCCLSVSVSEHWS